MNQNSPQKKSDGGFLVRFINKIIDIVLNALHLSKYREQIVYLFVGGGTTVVDWVVFALLWAVLAIFKLVFVGATPKAPKPVKEKPVEQAPVQTAPVAAPVAQSNDAELVAIITAAVAAYIAEEGTDAYSGGFRVVSFKRVRGGRTWNTK